MNDRQSCKACQDPQHTDVEREVWKCTIGVAEAAKRVGMSYEQYWVHLKFHGTEFEKVDLEDPHAVLNYLVRKLKTRIDTLVTLPIGSGNPALEKSVSGQIRLMKDLVMDIAKLTHQIETSPQIQIQNIVISQQNLVTAVLSDVCPECKNKLFKYLEVHH